MSTITREQSEIVLFRMNDIRDDVVQSIKQKALELSEYTATNCFGHGFGVIFTPPNQRKLYGRIRI